MYDSAAVGAARQTAFPDTRSRCEFVIWGRAAEPCAGVLLTLVFHPMMSLGRRLAVVLWSAVLAFLILIIGQSLWSVFLFLNFRHGARLPWSVPAMVVALWLIWQYLAGKWWPRSTSEARHRLLRANRVTGQQFVLALSGGIFAMVALAGYWIVFFQLVRTPPNALPDVSKYPVWIVVLLLAMSCLVSPVVEEIGFRGYCQQVLEREFAGPTAVALSSVLFTFAHANHGWFWPKLLVYFLAGIAFGAIAYLTNSIFVSIPVHIFGDAIFFTMVWPYDASRRLVTERGADQWFWLHLGQAVVFTALSLLIFRFLARSSSHAAGEQPPRVATA